MKKSKKKHLDRKTVFDTFMQITASYPSLWYWREDVESFIMAVNHEKKKKTELFFKKMFTYLRCRPLILFL